MFIVTRVQGYAELQATVLLTTYPTDFDNSPPVRSSGRSRELAIVGHERKLATSPTLLATDSSICSLARSPGNILKCGCLSRHVMILGEKEGLFFSSKASHMDCILRTNARYRSTCEKHVLRRDLEVISSEMFSASC